MTKPLVVRLSYGTCPYDYKEDFFVFEEPPDWGVLAWEFEGLARDHHGKSSSLLYHQIYGLIRERGGELFKPKVLWTDLKSVVEIMAEPLER